MEFVSFLEDALPKLRSGELSPSEFKFPGPSCPSFENVENEILKMFLDSKRCEKLSDSFYSENGNDSGIESNGFHSPAILSNSSFDGLSNGYSPVHEIDGPLAANGHSDVPNGGLCRAYDADDAVSVHSVSSADIDKYRSVIRSMARGDLDHRITDPHDPLAEDINQLADTLSEFVSRLSFVLIKGRMEGKLGIETSLDGFEGSWKNCLEDVNVLSNNYQEQLRDIAAVSIAVANGDLSKKVTVDAKGEFLVLKHTINKMVERLRVFAVEVSRVSLEVGTEGKLGGQAVVDGLDGIWKNLTYNVNLMASNLTAQVRDISRTCAAVACGDLSKKITVDVRGEILELKEVINSMVDNLILFSSEVARVAHAVGTEGRLGVQAQVDNIEGVWKELTISINGMTTNLTNQVRDIAAVSKAVARGDLSQKVTVDVKGEILELKNTINSMVLNLQTFATEVIRVSLEVGTEGKLGGQAVVKGVAGVWKDLTDNVNNMAQNLTAQVRSIAEVTTAVAQGDLSKKITIDVAGEIAEVKETVNEMVDRLNSFAAEVTRVALEVGTEGRLGGQAVVQGVAGVWKELTDNVNVMANNLTAQVRSIHEVTAAVACGDLSKKITVDTSGEILALKEIVNSMVDRVILHSTRSLET